MLYITPAEREREGEGRGGLEEGAGRERKMKREKVKGASFLKRNTSTFASKEEAPLLVLTIFLRLRRT